MAIKHTHCLLEFVVIFWSVFFQQINFPAASNAEKFPPVHFPPANKGQTTEDVLQHQTVINIERINQSIPVLHFFQLERWKSLTDTFNDSSWYKKLSRTIQPSSVSHSSHLDDQACLSKHHTAVNCLSRFHGSHREKLRLHIAQSTSFGHQSTQERR